LDTLLYTGQEQDIYADPIQDTFVGPGQDIATEQCSTIYHDNTSIELGIEQELGVEVNLGMAEKVDIGGVDINVTAGAGIDLGAIVDF
jgi:hypothetical protein